MKPELNTPTPKQPSLPTWVFALFALCALSPYLKTGYYQDDSINSLLPTYLAERGLSIQTFIWDGIRHWVTQERRLFPLTLAVSYSVWYFVRDLLTYRILQVGLVISNLLVFMRLIVALGGGRRLALLAGTIALGLFQLRDFHDPIASYAFLLQATLGLGLGSALLLCRFLDTHRKWMLYGSLALYACALLYYEVTFTFIPILFYLALKKSKPQSQQRFLALSGLGLVTAAYFGSILCLRLIHSTTYDGIQSNLRLKALATFAFQFSAALPLAYPIFGRSGFYNLGTLVSREFLSWGALGVLAASAAFLMRVYQMPAEKREEGHRRDLRIVGWALALIPAALVALSQKYQNQVTRPGVGYLPVYFSYFGIALLMALSFERVKRRLMASLALAALLAFTFSANRIAADGLNRYWKYPRVLMERAFHQGFLSEVPDGARLVVNLSCDWVSPDFFLHNSGKKLRVTRVENYTSKDFAPGDYLLDAQADPNSGGEVSVAAIEKVERTANPTSPYRIVTSPLKRTLRF